MRWIVPLAFILLLAAYRVLVAGFLASDNSLLLNFMPFAAAALCLALWRYPLWMALLIPVSALWASDIVINHLAERPLIGSYQAVTALGLLLVGAVGYALRGSKSGCSQPSVPRWIGASLAGSLLFYLVTNTASWAASPAYTADLFGWLQAITIGDPRFTPAAWVFFRNAALADLMFTGLFAVAMRLSLSASPETSSIAAVPTIEISMADANKVSRVKPVSVVS
ncbi:MAG: DUF6580 family putative transport protein [Verrucomicrobiales bacterium]